MSRVGVGARVAVGARVGARAGAKIGEQEEVVPIIAYAKTYANQGR
jgi:hypothetical protein